MRRCHECGKEFSVLRHILLRGQFCSESCANSSGKANVKMQEWVNRHHGQNTHPENPLHYPAFRFGAIPLQEGLTAAPLYFINADLSTFRIAQLMGPGQAVFGVEVPWPLAWRHAAAKNGNSGLPTMRQLVAPYVQTIISHTRNSACILAGHSFSGLMAFEAAHQLREHGIKVEMLMLVDTAAAHPTPYEVASRKLQGEWQKSQSLVSAIKNSWFTIRWMIAKEMRWHGRRFQQVVLRDMDEFTARMDELGEPLRWGLVERIYTEALRTYRLRPLDSRGFLFTTATKDQRLAGVMDESLGWNNLFNGGLEIIPTPGSHAAILLREPYNVELAGKMKRLIDQFRPSANSKPTVILRTPMA
jgi:thioesterase domain-containing protein